MRIQSTDEPRKIRCTEPIPMLGFAKQEVICYVRTGDDRWIIKGDVSSSLLMQQASVEYTRMCRDESNDLKGFTPLHAALFNRFIAAACEIPSVT